MTHKKAPRIPDYQTIFEHTPVSTQILTPDGKTILVNKAWEELWGLTLNQLENYNMLEDKQLEEKGILVYIKRGFSGESIKIPPIKYETPLSVPAETAAPFRWVHAQMYPIKDHTGQIEFIVLQHEDITEIKENEKELSETVQMLNTIITVSPLAVYVVDTDGNVQIWNDICEKMFGWKREEVIGKKLPIVQDDMQKEFQSLLQKLRAGESFIKETVRRKKDGSLFNVTISASPIIDENKKVVGVVAITADISDRKKSEEKLQHYASLVNSMSEAITATDMQYYITSWNKGAEELYGVAQKDVIGKHIYSVIHNEYISTPPEEIKKELFANGFWEGETIQVLKNGNRINARLSISLVKDADGNNIGTVAVTRDITRFRQTSIALRESEERLRLALEAGKIGVWDWKIKEDKIEWTPRVYEIHGLQPGEFSGKAKDFLTLVHPDDRDHAQNGIYTALKEKHSFESEFRIVRKDGSIRWITTSAETEYDSNDEPVRMLGATTDITSRKKLERQKDEFLAIASHELKTPLTSMKAFTQVMYNRMKKANDPHVNIISKMDTQINKITALVQDLLDVTKIESGQIIFRQEKFMFENMVRDTVEEVQRTTEKKLLVFGSSNKEVHGDRDRISQVLINFLTNAIKYSANADEIHIHIKEMNNQIRCEVQDFGIGIPVSKQSFVFERFYRVDEETHSTIPGIGLGLYISAEIIKRQGGLIGVQSEPGKGSKFYFSLPTSPSE